MNELQQIEDKCFLDSHLRRLSGREQFVLKRYHGLGAGTNTYDDIARELDKSTERIRQIHAKAMRKLRQLIIKEAGQIGVTHEDLLLLQSREQSQVRHVSSASRPKRERQISYIAPEITRAKLSEEWGVFLVQTPAGPGFVCSAHMHWGSFKG